MLGRQFVVYIIAALLVGTVFVAIFMVLLLFVFHSFLFTQCMRPICACSCIQNAPPVIITGVTAVAAIHVRHFVRQHSANFMQNIIYRRHHTCNGTQHAKKSSKERNKNKKRWTPNNTHKHTNTHTHTQYYSCLYRCFIVVFALLLFIVQYENQNALLCYFTALTWSSFFLSPQYRVSCYRRCLTQLW